MFSSPQAVSRMEPKFGFRTLKALVLSIELLPRTKQTLLAHNALRDKVRHRPSLDWSP